MTTVPGIEVVSALIGQVTKAVPKGGNERDVVTVISRPMWDLFCQALGATEPVEPSPKWGVDEWRVYGSETIVVNSQEYFSYSRRKHV